MRAVGEGRGPSRGQAAVPVGGGGAWPGFETTRRAELAARTARGRATARGRSEQPGLTQHAAPGTPAALHRKQSRSNTTKNARPATSIHSFTATLRKVI